MLRHENRRHGISASKLNQKCKYEKFNNCCISGINNGLLKLNTK